MLFSFAMQNIDQEWRELSERYFGMSDEEIEVLASEGYELTDMAREVLQGEIARRRLKIQIAIEPPSADPDPQVSHDPDFDPASLDLVSAGRVWDMDDARRVKTIFEDAGVPSFFGPDNVENVEALVPLFEAEKSKGLKRGFEVGIESKTPRAYQQRAMAALRWAYSQSPAAEIEAPEPEPDYAAKCPKCQSPEIVFEGLDRALDPAEANFRWHCDACGHAWSDNGVEEERSA